MLSNHIGNIECYLCGYKDAKELKPLGAYIKIECSNCNEIYGITKSLDLEIKNKNIDKNKLCLMLENKKNDNEALRDFIL